MPEWKNEISARLAKLRLEPTRENAIVEELAQDLDDCYAELLAGGATESEAYQQTLAELSGHELLAHELRRVERQVAPEPIVLGPNRKTNMIADLWQDLRFGARMLRKSYGFTAIAVLSLALGIGANTALFSVVDAMLLKKLPVREPERLVMFESLARPNFNYGGYVGNDHLDPKTGLQVGTSFPYQTFKRLREQQSVLSDIFAFGSGVVNINADGQADVARAQLVSGNYHTGLGVQPFIGRLLTDSDDQAAASPVVVLSYRYWQRRFNADPATVGKQVSLNNLAFTVVGVTPPGFDGTMQVGSSPDMTVPIVWETSFSPERNRMSGAGRWWLRLMGRLKPGATAEQARVQLENAFQQSVVEHRMARQAQPQTPGAKPLPSLEPKDYSRLAVFSGSQGEMDVRRNYAPQLYLLLGVVGMVLLIACANVANLLLARAAARQKEIGVRLALGANRWRLMRQLLTESVFLSAVGGLLGIVFALWIKNGLLSVGDWGGEEMPALDPKLDWRVFGFTLGLSLLTGMLFGSAPAWRATNVDLTPALKETGRSSSGVSRSWLGKSLVVAQVAMSLVLLIGAGLIVRTLHNLQNVNLGFNRENLLLFTVTPSHLRYKEERLAQLYRQMFARLEAVPGSRAVTFMMETLLSGDSSNSGVYLAGANFTAAADGRFTSSGNSRILSVRENYLEAMEIPLIQGRRLNPQDDERAPRVVVVNQAFAKRFFPNESPVGKRFGFSADKASQLEIVGVAGDTQYTSLREEIMPCIYIPWSQELRFLSKMTFAVRAAGEPEALVNAVREAVRSVDSNLPLARIKTQIEQADQSMQIERLFARLLGFFGLLALLLAGIGLYGVMAYAVAQRTQEIGIRVALGAQIHDVLMLVIGQGMILALVGVAVGIGGAIGLTGLLRKLLFGVSATDPLTFVAIAVLLLMVALVACLVPARRTIKVDPVIALRSE
jgi:predicted permease